MDRDREAMSESTDGSVKIVRVEVWLALDTRVQYRSNDELFVRRAEQRYIDNAIIIIIIVTAVVVSSSSIAGSTSAAHTGFIISAIDRASVCVVPIDKVR